MTASDHACSSLTKPLQAGGHPHMRHYRRLARRVPTLSSRICGRVRLYSDVSEIKIAFQIPSERTRPNFPPSRNVAPTNSLPIVRYDRKAEQRSLDVLRSGLIPYGPRTSRSVSPISMPRRADRGIMALAGLWENWKSPAGEWVRSFAIVTTEPNDLCAQLHNRMPVILAPDTWPAWLAEQPADEAQLKSLLAPYPSDGMIAWPVSTRVGNVKNNDPSLIEPVVAA